MKKTDMNSRWELLRPGDWPERGSKAFPICVEQTAGLQPGQVIHVANATLQIQTFPSFLLASLPHLGSP